MNLRRLIAGSAILLLAASPVFAQPAPTTPAPVLGSSSGLTADSSRSPIGFVPPTPDNIDDYVKAVGAVEVNAAFHSTSTVNAGPMTIKDGADVTLYAKYSKKNGQDEATLDGITLTAKGVDVAKAGPITINLQKAEIHADGSMTIKLNSWIPELKIKRVEKQPNGDVKLVGSWWMPDAVVTKDGDVKVGKVVNVFGAKIGGMKTVGHIDPRIFNNWPPTLEDLAAIAAAPTHDPNDPFPGALKQLSGGLAWDVKADADGLPITIDGAPVKAHETAALHGAANLKAGEIATVGSNNTAHVQIDFAKNTYGDANNGITLDKGGATIDGAYRFDVPLADAKNKMSLAFDGRASYSGEGENLHITLPDGAKISVGQLSASRAGDVHFQMNGQSRNLQLDDARYTLDVKGPIHIEKLGSISSADLDGEIRSQGLSKISANGLLSVDGDMQGEVAIRNAGLLPLLAGQKGFYEGGFKPGSTVKLDLDKVFAAVQLPLDGKPIAFQGADAHGTVTAHGDMENVKVAANGATITAPDATVDATATGSVKVRGRDITGDGKIDATLGLPGGAAVAVDKNGIKVATQLDPGSKVDLDANVSRTGGSAAPQAEQVVTTANLNARTGPSTSTNVLRVLPKGTTLTVLARQGDWIHAKAADGSTFWVSGKYAKTSKAASGAPVTTVAGKITGDLGATNATVSAFGGTGDVKGHVKARIDAPFKATIGSDGLPKIDTKATHATVPIRIDLKKGTKISYLGSTVTINDDACYVQLTGDIALDGAGKPVLEKLENVDIQLELGTASAMLLGKGITLPNVGTTHFTGDVTFSGKNITLHGKASTTLKGQTQPLFTITF